MSKVLIADDDPGFLVSLSIAMRRDGYEVWPAENSEQALDLLDAYKFDLMLIDIRLGPLLGVELAEWARLRDADLPIIFISAYSHIELEGRIRRITPYPVLEKPFEVGDVARTLSEQEEDAPRR
ncbi:MAG: response regulator [bacterium]|nr:response regulator [bacterium]